MHQRLFFIFSVVLTAYVVRAQNYWPVSLYWHGSNPIYFEALENSGTVELTVQRRYSAEHQGPMTVEILTENGTAQTGVDYVGIHQTIEFGQNEWFKGVTIQLLDTAEFRPIRDFTVRLRNASAGGDIVEPSVAHISVRDKLLSDVSVSRNDFFYDNVSVLDVVESAGSATFFLNRYEKAGPQASVAYRTSDGTAKAGVDYLSASGTATFMPGQNSRRMEIPLIDNNTVQTGPRDFFVTFEPGEFTRLIGTNVLRVMIYDDEPLAVTAGSTSRVEGMPARVTIQKGSELAPGSPPLRLTFATRDDPNNVETIAGRDYQSMSGEILFQPGENSKTIEIPTFNNSTFQTNASFLVHIESPDRPARNLPIDLRVQILDDEKKYLNQKFDFESYGFYPLTVFTQGPSSFIALGRRSHGYDGSPDTLYRLDENGMVDATFGGGKGYLRVGDGIWPVAVEPDGSLLVRAREAAVPLTSPVRLMKFTANGVMDTSYGDNGSSSLLPGVFRPDFSFYTIPSPENSFALVRVTSSGKIDPDFNWTGAPLDSPVEGIDSLKLLPDGNLIVCCTADQTVYEVITNGVAVALAKATNIVGIGYDSSSRVYVAFQDTTGAIRPSLKRFGSNGALETQYKPDFFTSIYSIIVLNDARVIVDGSNDQGESGSYTISADGSSFHATEDAEYPGVEPIPGRMVQLANGGRLQLERSYWNDSWQTRYFPTESETWSYIIGDAWTTYGGLPVGILSRGDDSWVGINRLNRYSFVIEPTIGLEEGVIMCGSGTAHVKLGRSGETPSEAHVQYSLWSLTPAGTKGEVLRRGEFIMPVAAAETIERMDVRQFALPDQWREIDLQLDSAQGAALGKMREARFLIPPLAEIPAQGQIKVRRITSRAEPVYMVSAGEGANLNSIVQTSGDLKNWQDLPILEDELDYLLYGFVGYQFDNSYQRDCVFWSPWTPLSTVQHFFRAIER